MTNQQQESPHKEFASGKDRNELPSRCVSAPRRSTCPGRARSSRANLDEDFDMIVFVVDKWLEPFLFNLVHLNFSCDHGCWFKPP